MGRIRRIADAGLHLMQRFALHRSIGRCLATRGVTIREATNTDVLEVQRWLNPNGVPSHALHRDPYVTNLVAHCLGQLAGFVQLVRHPPEHSPYVGYWLFSLYVESLWKRLGVGQALGQAVIEVARAEGAQTLDLLVFNDNSPAIQLYRKLGFEMHVISELEQQLAGECTPSGRRRVVMRKRLEKQG
jgi:GNAT superfamily N-acetyltransferase